MQAVILSGWLWLRMGESVRNIPKPMINVGDIPILIHIIDIYSHYWIKDFIICAWYKSEIVINYFASQAWDKKLSIKKGNKTDFLYKDCHVKVVDTGLETQTWGRIKKISPYISWIFHLTYWDWLSDINITELTNFHNENNGLVTLTAVNPLSNFGKLELDSNFVVNFEEKKKDYSTWINGWFFVVDPECLSYINDESDTWENILSKLTQEKKLVAYRHSWFWQCMDTFKDKEILEEIYKKWSAPWTHI